MTRDDDILHIGPLTLRSPAHGHLPRLYLFGHRVHHAIPGILLVLSDLPDWRRWLPDLVRKWA